STEKKDKSDEEARIAAQAAALPKPGPNPKLVLPKIQKEKFSNGMELWMVEQKELPIVSMNMVFKSGSASEPADRVGVANMTASLLDDGTTTRSAEQLANELRQIGILGIGAGSGWDSTNVSVQTLTKHLDKALELYADVVQNPVFPASEFESLRARSLV